MIRTVLMIVMIAMLSPLAVVSGQRHATPATTAEERMESWRQHQTMQEQSPWRNLRWRSVGPRKQGGRIEAIASPPGQPYTIYVGAGAGNVWKTTNNGTTWKPVFEHELTFAIGHIAVAPANPDVVWVGTGEVLMARSSYAGTGVFKSIDGGKSWSNMGLTDSHHIAKVLVHPTKPDTVYVAALGHLFSYNEQRGLYKTTDGGKTWQKSLYVNERVGVVDVAMDPRNPDVLFAVTWERSRTAWNHTSRGVHSGLHKSTDGGRTWRRLKGGLPDGKDVGRISVNLCRSHPDVVYALVAVPRGRGQLFRSDDGGQKWQRVAQDKLRADYDFCKVRVSPDSPDQIHIPGIRSFYSADGGKTLVPWGNTVVRLLDHGGKILHLDTHEMWIDPNNSDHLIIGNDGGVFVSYDRGRTWLHLNNLPIAEFYAVTVDMARPFNILGGTQDNAALIGPSDHRPEDGRRDPWQQIYLDPWGGGDSYFTYVDPQDAKTIYYEHQFGDLRRKNMKTGKTTRIRPRLPDNERLRFNWMSPFFLSHYGSKTLYFAANRVMKSDDRGDHWKAISPDLSGRPGPERQGNVPFGTITSLSESRLQQGLLVAGTDDGMLHLTMNDGAEWRQINAGLPAKWVTRVVASRHDKETLYVAMTGYREDDFRSYLFRSTDLGKSWQSIAANLPAESINVIGEDPRFGNVLYVGTDLGVYVSTSNGQRWESLCNNLPTTPVHDLVVHPRDFKLVIGTHGRSAFVMDVKNLKGNSSPKR